MLRLIRVLGFLLVLVAAMTVATGTAGSVGTSAQRDESLALSKNVKKAAGLDSQLGAIAEANHLHGTIAALRAARQQIQTLSGTRIEVEILARPRAAEAVARTVRRLKGRVLGTYRSLVDARVPVSVLAPLSKKPGVRVVRRPTRRVLGPPPHAPPTLSAFSFTALAAVVDEGVQTSGAAAWHADGVDGAGVRIGITDGGF